MLRAMAGRLGGGLLLVLVLTLLTYLVFATIPINVVLPEISGDERRAAARRQLGLDQPLLEQWGTFVWRLGSEGELGSTLSVFNPVSVNSILADALPVTASLVLGGFLLTLLVAVPLGFLSALRRRSPIDRGILLFTVVGIVMHPFVVGLALKWLFAERWGVAPDGAYCPLRGQTPIIDLTQGLIGTCGGFADWISHLWLPWLTFALFFLPLYTRIVRARVVENLGELYVLTARAKGASERQVVTRHVARNALGPIAAMLAVDVGTIVVAAIYVETVFGLNGVGLLVVQNISGQFGYDRNVLVGVVVVVALTIAFANVAADLVVRRLDPRVRLGHGGPRH